VLELRLALAQRLGRRLQRHVQIGAAGRVQRAQTLGDNFLGRQALQVDEPLLLGVERQHADLVIVC